MLLLHGTPLLVAVPVAVLLGSAGHPAAAQDCTAPYFHPHVQYPHGPEQDSIVAADFDQDGDLDLAVAEDDVHQVRIMLNAGDGTFADGDVASIASGEPQSMAVGDLDGDLDPDLVTIGGSGAEAISVLLNNGDGTFAPFVSYPHGSNPHSIALADLDGDLDRDIVVGGGFPLAMVYLNAGDGTFGPGTSYGSSSGTLAGADVVIDELDGVNGPDLAVTSGSGVSILLNDGDGTFTPSAIPSYVAENWSIVTSLVIAELDGSPGLDIAAIDLTSGTIGLLINDGSGLFFGVFPPPTFPSGGGASPFGGALAAADVDGDGDIDLAAVHSNFGDFVSVMLSNGDATLAAPLSYDTGAVPGAVCFGDLDGNGSQDMAVTNLADGSVSILLSTCESSTTCAEDTNGDGFVDVTDLVNVIVAWGTPDGDVTGDGLTDVQDLVALILAWGSC